MPTILKIPFDKCIVEKERRGAALAPDIIQKEAENFFLTEEGKDWRPGINWVDVPIAEEFEKTTLNIENAFLKNKDVTASLGGDNSVSYGLMKAFTKGHKDAALLYFDAHFDVEHDFLPPTHEDILRAAVNERLFKPENILIVGVRNYTKEELEFINKNNIKYVLAKDFSPDKVREFAKNHKTIYFMLDIDVTDPRYAPGTGWPEPMGLHPRDVLSLILELKSNIKLLDIVEVSPPRDINNITARLAAKILIEYLKS